MSDFERKPKPEPKQAEQTDAKASAKHPASDPVSVRGGGGDPRAAMYRPASMPHPNPRSVTADLDPSDAHAVLYAAYNVLQGKRPDADLKITSQNSTYVKAVDILYEAASGRGRRGETLNGARKRDLFSQAKETLAALVPICEKGQADTVEFVEQYYVPRIQAVSQDMSYAAASERVDNAILTASGAAVDLPPDGEPREQAEALQPRIKEFNATVKSINEQIVRFREDSIEEEAKEMFEKGERGGRFGSLAELGNALTAADAWLTLSDNELKEHLADVRGVWNGVSTYTELVKAVLEALQGGGGVLCSVIGLVARASGNLEIAANASGLARQIATGTLGTIISVIEVAHGLAVILDGHASQEQKLEAGKDVAVGTSFLVGKRLGGAVVGATASTAVMAGYLELKLAMDAYVGAVVGIDTAVMRQVYETLSDYGEKFRRIGEQVMKAHSLAAQETDPERRDALTRVENYYVQGAASSLDGFIAKCAPASDSGNADHVQMRDFSDPGQFYIMQELFYAPLSAFQGAQKAEVVIAGIGTALEKIAWAKVHANEILVAAINHRRLKDAEAIVEAEDAKKKGGSETEP